MVRDFLHQHQHAALSKVQRKHFTLNFVERGGSVHVHRYVDGWLPVLPNDPLNPLPDEEFINGFFCARKRFLEFLPQAAIRQLPPHHTRFLATPGELFVPAEYLRQEGGGGGCSGRPASLSGSPPLPRVNSSKTGSFAKQHFPLCQFLFSCSTLKRQKKEPSYTLL